MMELQFIPTLKHKQFIDYTGFVWLPGYKKTINDKLGSGVKDKKTDKEISLVRYLLDNYPDNFVRVG